MSSSFFEYLRLKAIISVLRLTVTTATPHPDDIYSIQSRDRTRTININVYRPKTSSAKPTPVLLNFFGGAFVLPGHGSDDLFCRTVVDQTDKFTVLDASYALGPEYPFPAALQDIEDLITHVVSEKSDIYDINNIVLSGFSSGGNLALSASTSTLSSKSEETKVRAVVAFYPATDMSTPRSEKVAPDGSKSEIPQFVFQALRDSYVPKDVDPSDSRLTVLNADAGSFPENVLVLTAEKDVLAKEAEELAEKVEKDGMKRVVRMRFEGVGHGWDKMEDEVSVAARDESYGMVVKFLMSLVEE
jgi:acetyl esterase/lipase